MAEDWQPNPISARWQWNNVYIGHVFGNDILKAGLFEIVVSIARDKATGHVIPYSCLLWHHQSQHRYIAQWKCSSLSILPANIKFQYKRSDVVTVISVCNMMVRQYYVKYEHCNVSVSFFIRKTVCALSCIR